MEDTQTAVATPVADVETTTSEPAITEKTAVTETEPSVEKKNTEAVEGEGEGKEDLSTKTVPYSALKSKVDTINSLKKELEALKNQSPTQAPQGDDQETLVKQALEKLGYVDKNYVETKISDAIAQDRVYRELDQTAQRLAKEWDGADGKPKFDVDEVVEYGTNVGVHDLDAAFKLMNAKPLAEYYAKQAKTGLKTERQGKPVQNVGADMDALMKEARETGDFTKVLKQRLKK